MAAGTTDQVRNYRLPAVPLPVLALLSAAVISGVAGILIYTELRDRKETPEYIASCHAQGGTARLDRRGTYRGCLVPSTGAR
jgi:hypothetical protein